MGTRNCGECLMDAVEIVELDAQGLCPRCGANYGPEPAGDDTDDAPEDGTRARPARRSPRPALPTRRRHAVRGLR